MVSIRPTVEMDRHVNEVLHYVERHRTLWSWHAEESLDAQHIPAVPMNEQRQPDGKWRPIDRLRNPNGKAYDRAPMPVVSVFFRNEGGGTRQLVSSVKPRADFGASRFRVE